MATQLQNREGFFHTYSALLVCLFLIASTFCVYWQITESEFVYFDDGAYVADNPHVKAGLTLEGVVWAFTAVRAGMYHPLTWLTHMLDCQIFGMNAGLHHLTNLFLHIANSLLLFLVLRRMTGALWRSSCVAALFALHPLHVESVAWVSERKDLLSALFWMLTTWSYVTYTRHPGIKTYLAVCALFVLGLLAKPMLVTLPFVFLLLDYWPLERLRLVESDRPFRDPNQRRRALHLIAEKVPLLALTAVASVIAYIAQNTTGSTGSLEQYPLHLRIENSLVSYAVYAVRMIWPRGLAAFYPYLNEIPTWKTLGAALFLACTSIAAFGTIRRRPYLSVGWLWYLGTLVPVIGLVQVGSQSMADRYTYIPLIGLFIAVSWGGAELAAKWRRREIVLGGLACAILPVLMWLSWLQAGYWKNSVVLFEHAIDVTRYNYVAHYNLGNVLVFQAKPDKAVSHYLETIRIRPDHAKAHNNLARVLASQGKGTEALDHYYKALKIDPGFASPHYNLGGYFSGQGNIDKAAAHYSEAVRLNPGSAEARSKLAEVLLRQGRLGEAVRQYAEVLRLRPDFAAHYNLGVALLEMGSLDEAIRHFAESLRLMPGNALAHNNMGNALARKGLAAEAVTHYAAALRINPHLIEAHLNLGVVLSRQGDFEGAIQQFSQVLRIQPENRKARRGIEQTRRLMAQPAEEPEDRSEQ
ncbi:tetratricopeptide repeat protein [Thermodesulfobacteriota bacterium]